MNHKLLITYATKSGSTAEVAQFIGQELRGQGAQVDVAPISTVGDIGAYQAVIIGAPMIMGWHPDAVRFIERNQNALSRIPVSYFLLALNLTRTGDGRQNGVAVFQDPSLAKPPRNAARLSFKENYATVSNYLDPVLKKTPQVKPVSVGFFNGKLDLDRLDLFSRLFVSLIIGAQPGDFRNWDAIRSWAADQAVRLG